MTSNSRKAVKGKQARTWKKDFITYFKVVFHHLFAKNMSSPPPDRKNGTMGLSNRKVEKISLIIQIRWYCMKQVSEECSMMRGNALRLSMG
jgi:hypothetical protein